MIPAVRRRRIVELVSERGSCSVDLLAEEMACSKATIRRDLSELEAKGLIERSHGGAVPATSVGEEQSYRQKEVQNLDAKMAIGERASEEIHPNQVVFFDAGSTTMQVAKEAADRGPFLAVTNSPFVALELATGDGEVKLTGGSLRPQTRALVGPSAERFMDRISIDVLFLGTNAVDRDRGLMTPNEDEAAMKSLMIERADRVVLVADGTKFGERSFLQFGTIEDLDQVVTDTRLSANDREAFADAGVELVEDVS